MVTFSASRSHLGAIVWIVVFVLTGLAGPLVVSSINFMDSPPKTLLWPLYPQYLGNLLVGIWSPRLTRCQWSMASKLFIFDAAAQAFTNVGLIMIGAPLYSIIYKSVTVFTGCFSLCLLPPASHPSRLQWGAIAIITGGLVLSSLNAAETLSMSRLGGCVIMFLGCIFYAGGAVISEQFLGESKDVLHPFQVAWTFGVEGLCFCVFWGLWTLREMPFSTSGLLLLAALMLCNAGHQAAWFTLVGQVGACATAVLKAFQSVCIFFTASVFFCHLDSAECLTTEKVVSFLVVTSGVLLYSWPQTSSQSAADASGAGEPFQIDASANEQHDSSGAELGAAASLASPA
eukprot:TRINITY_DN33074_c0_g1_i1.p1 TRINITY_DN33074_c0_g1~~TRINITY_DN33074_c0_g1_i1.p1  ORF type:complete len:344 (+),score=18.32 TRINITY_DN33074_c0_g1_i1:158-1189(+)